MSDEEFVAGGIVPESLTLIPGTDKPMLPDRLSRMEEIFVITTATYMTILPPDQMRSLMVRSIVGDEDQDLRWEASWELPGFKEGETVGYSLRTTFSGKIRITVWDQEVGTVERVPLDKVGERLAALMPQSLLRVSEEAARAED